ncbi:lipid droplet-associated hydrolase isoform X2 [Vitis riparia]|uniref:lipid droplet-associated hydrolase isoform X2 n=1 Tax=Vitis riparia TaxID=96939 RepID=UPI00155A3250|nr:lipid droplet-associated hydrolase isoform X2 [Vitis riparia]
MLERFCATILRPICFSLSFPCRIRYISKCASCLMDHENLLPSGRSLASFRLCSVSGYTTELLDIHAEEPKLHVLFIPGNPGVASFYKDFVESLYELLGGSVSVTAIGHVSHTKKNWEHGRLFSLQDQIDHKMDFIQHELKNIDAPILLVGHSIGAYISMEMFRRSPDKVIYYVGLYPFLALNSESRKQTTIGKISASPILCAALSSIVAFLGLLPRWASGFIVSNSLGKSWSSTAVEALCSHLLKLSEPLDWVFMREKRSQIAFLFGVDDHWGPLQMLEEISKQAPDVALSIEREGHSHAFCCTEAGSLWVAQHVANLIKNQISSAD